MDEIKELSLNFCFLMFFLNRFLRNLAFLLMILLEGMVMASRLCGLLGPRDLGLE
jgi:hypothetical protein